MATEPTEEHGKIKPAGGECGFTGGSAGAGSRSIPKCPPGTYGAFYDPAGAKPGMEVQQQGEIKTWKRINSKNLFPCSSCVSVAILLFTRSNASATTGTDNAGCINHA
ncbi:MAG: hypothetical protein WBO37_15605 [Gammaproteobacteria bacterium]